MIKLIFVALAVMFSTAARADYPADLSGKIWFKGIAAMGNAMYPTSAAACVAMDAYWKTTTTASYYSSRGPLIANAGETACVYSGESAIKGTTYGTLLKVTNKCPSGGTLSADGRTCIQNTPPPIDPKPCEDKNEFVRRWDYGTDGLTPAPDHYGVCNIEIVKLMVCRKEPSGITYCIWMVKRTGTLYEGTDTPGSSGSDKPEVKSEPPTKSPPIQPPPGQKCPVGTVQAGSSSDGTPICMGTGSQPPNVPAPPPKIESEKSEPQADGSTKTTKTTTQTNADGSTTTSTTVTVTQADGTKVTTGDKNTTKNSAGADGSEDTPENDKYDMCKVNPNLTICRNSSVAGACGQITCVGDAIQCATLRAAAAMECKQRSDEQALKDSPLTAKGNAAISGSDIAGDNLPTAKNATVVNLPGSGDTAGWLGGGSPFDDVTFVVFGHSITLPFAKWSGYLIALRYALMVAASLISFRILSGSILRE